MVHVIMPIRCLVFISRRHSSQNVHYPLFSLQLVESKWASELSNLQETQKREYRDWVMKVHEDTQTTAGTPTYVYVKSEHPHSPLEMNSNCQPDNH